MNLFFLYLMSTLYTLAGLLHFWKPKIYKPIIPPSIPKHDVMIFLSGVAEVMLGLGLLWEPTRSLSAWGVIALLIAVSPVHFYMLQQKEKFHTVPVWILWLRLPLQILLMVWAYAFT